MYRFHRYIVPKAPLRLLKWNIYYLTNEGNSRIIYTNNNNGIVNSKNILKTKYW